MKAQAVEDLAERAAAVEAEAEEARVVVLAREGWGGFALVAVGLVVQVVASGTQELQYSEIRPAVLALVVMQDSRELLLELGAVVAVVVASVTTLRE